MKALGKLPISSAVQQVSTPSPSQAQTREGIHILSIGAIEHSYTLHDALLEGGNSDYCAACDCHELWMILDYRDLWTMSRHETIHLAILHDTLNSFELDEACRFIRRQWSSARILLIRRDEGLLDDALYDVRIMPDTPLEFLRAAIIRLLEGRRS